MRSLIIEIAIYKNKYTQFWILFQIMNKIFGYLSHRDRLAASGTCRWWHQTTFASTFSVNQHILIHARSNRDRSFHRRLLDIFTRTYNGFPSFTFKNIEIFDIPNLFWKRNSQTIKHLHFYRYKLLHCDSNS